MTRKRPDRPCRKCAKATSATSGVCQKCAAKGETRDRPTSLRPCLECGKKCRSASQVCGPCIAAAADLDPEPVVEEIVFVEPYDTDSPDALLDGRWVNHRGIMRWEATPPPPPPAPKPVLERPKESKPLQGVDPLRILAATADYYGLTVAEMHQPGEGREPHVALADGRHVARWLLRKTGMSISAVARVTSRDRSTAHNSLRRVGASPRLMQEALELLYMLRDERDERGESAA